MGGRTRKLRNAARRAGTPEVVATPVAAPKKKAPKKKAPKKTTK